MATLEDLGKRFKALCENTEKFIPKEQEELAKKRYCIVQLKDGTEVCCFETKLGINLFDVAEAYHYKVRDGVGCYDLGGLAQSFGEIGILSDNVYASLYKAMSEDDSIQAAMVFDFDKETLSICNNQNGEWKTYALEDISEAVWDSEDVGAKSSIGKQEAFLKELVGKEVEQSEIVGHVMNQ